MSGMLQGLLTLAGVVVGAVCTYFVQARVDRGKWQRDHNARWDVRRMETYAAYGNAVKRTTMLAHRMAAERGLTEAIAPLSSDEGRHLMSEAQGARAALWEEMLLLGDPATLAAARRWHESSWLLDEFARGFRSDAQGWHAAVIEVNDARAEFHRAARADLGVPGVPPINPNPRMLLPGTATAPQEAASA
jgi:hypothetical protein